MHHESCYIDAPDDHKIYVNIWKKTKATKKPRAILHINHGMAEQRVPRVQCPRVPV